MSRRKSEGPTHLLCVVVATSADDIPPAIAHQRAHLRGSTVTWAPSPPALWNPGITQLISAGNGREAMIIPIDKLDPSVKFIAVYIDDVDPSMYATLGEPQ